MTSFSQETPLTKAVIKNDINIVKELANQKEQVFAKNFLGFNSIELAKYLGRRQCLQLLSPEKSKIFKVLKRNHNDLISLNEEEYSKLFSVNHLKHLTFGGYDIFKKVVTSYSEIYRIQGGAAEFEKNYSQKDLNPRLIEKFHGTPEEYTVRTLVYRKKIDEGYVVPTRIMWIDDLLEYGLFADDDIKKDDYIGEYIGVITYSSPSIYRVSGYSIQYPNYHPVRFDLDPKLEGNELRFANHSYRPNMGIKLSFDKGIIHSIFFANHDIPKGAQLTWNYGTEYWEDIEPPLEIPN